MSLPNRVWSQVLCDFRIVGSAEVSKSGNYVLLTDFKGNNRSVGHVLNKRDIFWEDTFVYIVELFDDGSRKIEHFHRRNFESLAKDRINYLTCESLFNNVRLDYAESTVVKYCSRLHWSSLGIASKPKLGFSLVRGRGVRPVNGVVGSIHAKLSSNRVWRLEFSYRCVSFSNYLSPLNDSFSGHQLKAYTDIASHGI